MTEKHDREFSSVIKNAITIAEDMTKVINTHVKLLEAENKDMKLEDKQILGIASAQMLVTNVLSHNYKILIALDMDRKEATQRTKDMCNGFCAALKKTLKDLVKHLHDEGK